VDFIQNLGKTYFQVHWPWKLFQRKWNQSDWDLTSLTENNY